MHKELHAHGLSRKRCHVHYLIGPSLGIDALMKNGLQDVAVNICDVGILPIEIDAVSRAIPMPKA